MMQRRNTAIGALVASMLAAGLIAQASAPEGHRATDTATAAAIVTSALTARGGPAAVVSPAATLRRAASSRPAGRSAAAVVDGRSATRGSTNAANKKTPSQEDDITGQYVSDLLCGYPQNVQPGPGTPPEYVDATCVGGSVYAGDLTGHTLYNIQSREYVNGDARSMAPFTEWFYGRLGSDGSTGGLHFEQKFATYVAATDTFHVEGDIVGGTCDFAGASGPITYDGNLIQGTFAGHLVRPAVRPASASPCNPLGPSPLSSGASTSPGTYSTSVQGGWVEPACVPTSAAPKDDGSTHVEVVCTLTSTGTWAGQEVEHITGDIGPDLQMVGVNDYDLYGRNARDNTCGSLKVHEILWVDGLTGATYGLDTIVSGTDDWAGSTGQFVIDGSVFGGPGVGGYHGTWTRPGTPKPTNNVPCLPPAPSA